MAVFRIIGDGLNGAASGSDDLRSDRGGENDDRIAAFFPVFLAGAIGIVLPRFHLRRGGERETAGDFHFLFRFSSFLFGTPVIVHRNHELIRFVMKFGILFAQFLVLGSKMSNLCGQLPFHRRAAMNIDAGVDHKTEDDEGKCKDTVDKDKRRHVGEGELPNPLTGLIGDDHKRIMPFMRMFPGFLSVG